LENRLWVHKDL